MKIGDRVKHIEFGEGVVQFGAYGGFAVKFDTPNTQLHDCSGFAVPGNVWSWVSSVNDMIEVVEPDVQTKELSLLRRIKEDLIMRADEEDVVGLSFSLFLELEEATK